MRADGCFFRVPLQVSAAEAVDQRVLVDPPEEPLQVLVLLSVVCRLDPRFRHGSTRRPSLPARSAAVHLILTAQHEKDTSARVGVQLPEGGVELLALPAISLRREILYRRQQLLLSEQDGERCGNIGGPHPIWLPPALPSRNNRPGAGRRPATRRWTAATPSAASSIRHSGRGRRGWLHCFRRLDRKSVV